MTAPNNHPELLRLATDIVTSHVANNAVALSDLPQLIERVYASLAQAGTPPAPAEAKQEPAVSVRASVKPDHLVCLEDGKKYKILKQHLRAEHGLTPAEYRAKWRLPADYPMTAPGYAASRSALAKQIGLGGWRTARATAAAPNVEPGKASGRRKLGIAVPQDES